MLDIFGLDVLLSRYSILAGSYLVIYYSGFRFSCEETWTVIWIHLELELIWDFIFFYWILSSVGWGLLDYELWVLSESIHCFYYLSMDEFVSVEYQMLTILDYKLFEDVSLFDMISVSVDLIWLWGYAVDCP